jgi:hypothetical protein
MTPIERIENRTIITPGPMPTDCHICHLATSDTGYVHLKVNGRTVSAHRTTYEHVNGPIPPGLMIDHLCRQRNCVNPEHMEAVTNRTNVLRGQSPIAIAVRTNKCIRNHDMTDAYIAPTGHRQCRTCNRIRARARYHNATT